MRRPDSELRYQAMVREMEAHLENGTWELVKPPRGPKAIGSKWVFKVKRNPDASSPKASASAPASISMRRSLRPPSGLPSVLCRFMSKPGPAHWKAAKHLFRYLRGSVDYRLTYAPDPSSSQLFTTYSDADHGGNPDNSRSTSAYVVKMGTGAVSWMSRLQSIVALSTTEAEFISAVSAGQEIVWMRSFLGELGYSFDAPSPLLVDNQSAIQVARNPEHHGRMKHLDLRFFWLRDIVNAGVIAVRYIPTADMAADLLTKALARVKVAAALPQLGLTAP
jgi:hypothetical protein